jgi:hypothetical protein
MSGFLPVRTRHAKATLRELKVDSSTGPDGIPARILKMCASALAIPVALLTRIILKHGVWPNCWKIHWLFPLFKKKSKANPDNYRGIHLTPQISKVAERLLGRLFQPFLEMSGAYGPNQFAYTKERGAKDALALMLLHWILDLSSGKRVGLYCSDVSGAFDRVSPSRLYKKLQAKGVHPQLLAVLHSWLEDRSAVVIVDGIHSNPGPLRNSVYQGTVLGPPLWNCYYEDSRLAVNAEGFAEIVFADDLNCFKSFERFEADAVVLDGLRSCQTSLHEWGAANQVQFDPGKESLHILDSRNPFGEDFTILGITFDTRLVMQTAAHDIAAQAGWRVRSLLRCRRFFSNASLAMLYKSHILSYIEFGTAALYHAPAFMLLPVDPVQELFVIELGISSREALLELNLAPLSTRRDIAMLGLLHRISSGKAPPQFSKFIFPGSSLHFPRDLRHQAGRHNRQFHDPIDGTQSRMMERSLFGAIYTFNMLPQSVVDAKTTSRFQHELQNAVKALARTQHPEWDTLLRTGVRNMSGARFQSCFANRN